MCNCSTALVTDSRSRETPAIRIYVRSPCIFLLHLIENKNKKSTNRQLCWTQVGARNRVFGLSPIGLTSI